MLLATSSPPSMCTAHRSVYLPSTISEIINPINDTRNAWLMPCIVLAGDPWVSGGRNAQALPPSPCPHRLPVQQRLAERSAFNRQSIDKSIQLSCKVNRTYHPCCLESTGHNLQPFSMFFSERYWAKRCGSSLKRRPLSSAVSCASVRNSGSAASARLRLLPL